MMYAVGNLNVQRQSLELAQQSLKDNRARVEIGTMAPIDIVQAEAEVAQREESLILAEAAISRAEDRLRALVFNPSVAGLLAAADRADRADRVPPDAGGPRSRRVQRPAEAHRPAGVAQAARFERRQHPLLQEPDDAGRQRLAHLLRAGDRRHGVPARPAGFPGEIIGAAEKSYGSTLGTMFSGDFPTWTVSMQVNYPIGYSNAEASLARARLQDQQSRKQLQSQELQVATQVRDYARQVQTNAKRVDATRASRTLAERRLEAEEKKFQAGMTTSFLVFQAQRDLNQARNNELQALLDYFKSVVDFEAAQEAPLTGSGWHLDGEHGRLHQRHDRHATARRASTGAIRYPVDSRP